VITIYGMMSPNVLKVLIAVEEMGLPHRVQPLDVFGGQQLEPEFLQLNPNGKVPVILDEDGPDGKPQAVFESGAILLYLAEKSGAFLPKESRARFEAIQWLMVQLTAVGPMFGQFFHFLRYAPQGHEYSLSRYQTHFIRACEVIDRRLAQSNYIGAPDYTIVDMATYPFLRNVARFVADAADRMPNITKWNAAVAARPAVVRATQALTDLQDKSTQFEQATPEDRDRFFGRGKFAAH
jgi:GST-like protein